MAEPSEHVAHMALLPALCSQRPTQTLITNAGVGADHLAWLIRNWSPQTLREANLTEAIATVDGIRQLLAELRQHIHADQGVRIDGGF